MREEVLSQMEVERQVGTTASTPDATSGHVAAAQPGSEATAGGSSTTASGFRFAALGKELVVAGVFVRVYNEQPNFPVADPAAFCKGLVTFIHALMKPEVSSRPSAAVDSDQFWMASAQHTVIGMAVTLQILHSFQTWCECQ